jgi:hypothetical protein
MTIVKRMDRAKRGDGTWRGAGWAHQYDRAPEARRLDENHGKSNQPKNGVGPVKSSTSSSCPSSYPQLAVEMFN